MLPKKSFSNFMYNTSIVLAIVFCIGGVLNPFTWFLGKSESYGVTSVTYENAGASSNQNTAPVNASPYLTHKD
jgi:hypothetical protein